MKQPTSAVSRRTLFAGAGTVGALAAVASLLPSVRDASAPEQTRQEPPTRGGGYQLSEHVQRYFKTTRI